MVIDAVVLLTSAKIKVLEQPGVPDIDGKLIQDQVLSIDRKISRQDVLFHLDRSLQMAKELAPDLEKSINELNKNVADVFTEEMLDKVYIISDMEFDSAKEEISTPDQTLFNVIRSKFTASGYEMPQIVFWNVDSRNNQFPMSMDERGFLNVSGYSPSIFKNLVNNNIVSPHEFMMEILDSERYQNIEI